MKKILISAVTLALLGVHTDVNAVSLRKLAEKETHGKVAKEISDKEHEKHDDNAVHHHTVEKNAKSKKTSEHK